MNRYILLLILLFSFLNYTIADERNQTLDELVNNLEKTLVSDPQLKKSLYKEKEQGFQVVESEDKQIRIVSWKINDEWNRILQYKVGKKVARCVHYNDRFDNLVPYGLIDINLDPGDKILKIYKLQTGIYMLETVCEFGESSKHKLLGVDISRGLLKKAYLFSDESDYASNIIEFNTLDDEYKFIVDEWNLKVPDMENTKYAELFYNGSHYVNSEEYEKQRPFLDRTDIYFSRIYFKDPENIETIAYMQNASDNISLMVDIAHGKDKVIRDTLAPILLSSSEVNEHKSGELFTYYLKLKPINNRIFIENASLYNIPFEVIDTTQDRTLSKVVFSAGKNEALVYETLRYTAMAFNCILNGNDDHKIKWAVLVGNKLEKLEGKKYQGAQIDLQMRKKWIGKEIIVIPYIEGFDIDRKIGIKTQVKAKYDLE